MKQNSTFFRAGPSSARRAALLGTVAASALWVAAQPAAAGPDACVVVANEVTCSGNQSGGIRAGNDFNMALVDTLTINNLTQDIAPLSSSGSGVYWIVGAGRPINFISNTGSFSINAALSGMQLFTSDAPITMSHTGNIQAGGDGILAVSNSNGGLTNAGAVSVTMNGNIVARAGITARSEVLSGNGNAGTVNVSHQGSLSVSGNGRGIEAQSGVVGIGDAAAVTVDNAGSITAATAIAASSRAQTDGNAGAVNVTSAGDLTGRVDGVVAESFATGVGSAGSVLIHSTGNIRTDGSGLEATSIATGAGNANVVTVNSTGNINAGPFGIVARSVAETGNE